MDFELSFTFRNASWSCIAYIDASEEPCYVFVQLQDSKLITEFGDELTIKTDFEQRLPKKDDWGQLLHLREAVFNALKDHPHFRTAKRHYLLHKSLQAPKAFKSNTLNERN